MCSCGLIYHLQVLHRCKVAELLSRPGERAMRQLVQIIFILQDSLSCHGCPSIKQLVGNHGSDGGLAWIGHSSAIVPGLRSLAGSDCLGHLRHHGQNTCWQLLGADVRQAEVLLFRTFHENNVCKRRLTFESRQDSFNKNLPKATPSTEPGSKKVTLRPSLGFFTGV